MVKNIETLNKQLKQLNIGVTIRQRGRRLYLRATLPAKPGCDRPPHQQEISLGIYANSDGFGYAKDEAIRLGASLATKTFTWANYIDPVAPPTVTIADWIDRYKKDYFNRRGTNPKTETTWDKDYRLTFAKLPQNETLSPEVCLKLIGKTEPRSRARQRYVMALTSLCRFAGLSPDFSGLSKYSPGQLTPRDLPSDDLIEEVRSQIQDPAWQWVYGMIATYGLRPHEVFLIDQESFLRMNPNIWIGDGKTGSRTIYPHPSDWWEKWELYFIQLPKFQTPKNNSGYGAKVLRQFKKYKIPFKPYDLRHRWAIRTLELGLDRTLAAKQMGHSREIHDKIYHRWISEDIHREAFNNLKKI